MELLGAFIALTLMAPESPLYKLLTFQLKLLSLHLKIQTESHLHVAWFEAWGVVGAGRHGILLLHGAALVSTVTPLVARLASHVNILKNNDLWNKSI